MRRSNSTNLKIGFELVAICFGFEGGGGAGAGEGGGHLQALLANLFFSFLDFVLQIENLISLAHNVTFQHND